MQLTSKLFFINKLTSAYNIVPKRVKFLLATLINFLLISTYVLIFSDGLNLFNAAVFGLVSVLLYVFVLLFGITTKNFLKSISVPAIYIFSTFLILHYFPNLNTYFKLVFATFSSFIYYFLLLSLNVFFVVEEKGTSIPLLRPAKTTFLLIEVVTLFLFFTVLYKFTLPEPFIEVTFIFQALVVSIVGFLFTAEYWWSQNMEQEITSFVGNESLTIGFLLGVIAISLSFFSTEAFFRALGLITSFYICISFVQSIVTHKLNKSQYLEYLVLALLVILFLLVA